VDRLFARVDRLEAYPTLRRKFIRGLEADGFGRAGV